MRILYNALLVSTLVTFGMNLIPNTLSVLYLNEWFFGEVNLSNTVWYFYIQSLSAVIALVLLITIALLKFNGATKIKFKNNEDNNTQSERSLNAFKKSIIKPRYVNRTVNVLVTLILFSSIAVLFKTGVSDFWFINSQFGLSISLISVVALIMCNYFYSRLYKTEQLS